MKALPPAHSAEFIQGARDKRQFPEPLGYELAFLGRSNCGKSSLLNYFLGRKALARVSSTPGRTREINFFKVSLAKDALSFLVSDLPGYGFAKAPIKMVESWRSLVESYLTEKRGQRALLLMDIRRGIQKEEDLLLGLLNTLEIPRILVLTKGDKLTSSERLKKLKSLKEELGGDVPLVVTSATTGLGRPELMREAIPEPFLGALIKYLA
ncbi:MAG: ribosome biogenesis GTP-binding protein YihA/YsxC [Deltaproteobacteria bacterium]|jgi:GTP-binding protein|nr:ribosome biogenesis GTP-binding protein YihA/YsxC [Deltaproteobacteria bacterium]